MERHSSATQVGRRSTPQRMLLICVLVAALLAVAQPASAAMKWASPAMKFRAAETATKVATTIRVARGGQGTVARVVWVGSGGDFHGHRQLRITFGQLGARAGDRYVAFAATGQPRTVTGSCYMGRIPGLGSTAVCEKPIKWRTDRPYRIKAVAGATDSKGTWWTVTVKDLEVGRSWTIGRVQAGMSRVARSGHLVSLAARNDNGNCEFVGARVVWARPVASGTRTWWAADDIESNCGGAVASADVVRGRAVLQVR